MLEVFDRPQEALPISELPNLDAVDRLGDVRNGSSANAATRGVVPFRPKRLFSSVQT